MMSISMISSSLSFRHFDRHPAHLEDLRRRDRRRAARAARLPRRRAAQAFWPLSCRHRFILLNPGQPKPRELAEVVELQHPAGAEDLQPLLREALVAVGEVMDRADRAVGELQGDRQPCRRSPPAPGGGRAATAGADDRRAGQVAQQVDEVAALADDAAAADRRVLRPVVGAGSRRR